MWSKKKRVKTPSWATRMAKIFGYGEVDPLEMTDLDVEEGVKRCLDNARSLLKDARLLLKNDSAGHALLFVISAIEETSKALICSGIRTGIKSAEEAIRDLFKHPPKLNLFISYLIAAAMEDVFAKRRNRIFHPEHPDKPLNIDNFVEMAQDSKKAHSDLWKDRLAALYVDIKNGRWTSPSEIERSKVEALLELAERYLHDTNFQTRNILKAPKDVAVEYHRWLQTTLIPFAKKYLQDHIDELYKDKVITKRSYEMIKKKKLV